MVRPRQPYHEAGALLQGLLIEAMPGASVADFAASFEVTAATVSRWLSGRNRCGRKSLHVIAQEIADHVEASPPDIVKAYQYLAAFGDIRTGKKSARYPSGDIPYLAEDWIGHLDEFEPRNATTPVPDLPLQGAGPKFTISDGVLRSFSPPELDPRSDRELLEQLHPLLLETVDELASLLEQTNAYPDLLRLADAYRQEIDTNLDSLSFPRLFQRGLRLHHYAKAASREVDERLIPALDDPLSAALESVLDMHGPFILASRDGAELVALADRYSRQPDQEADFRAAASDLVDNLGSIAEPAAVQAVSEAVDGMASHVEVERSAVYGLTTVRNVSIVLAAGAVMSYVATLAATAPLEISIPAAIAGLAVLEATKKTKAFASLSEPLRATMDSLSNDGLKDHAKRFAANFRRVRDFVLHKEPQLRTIAGRRREMLWLHEQLDFIKSVDVDGQRPLRSPGMVGDLAEDIRTDKRASDNEGCPVPLVVEEGTSVDGPKSKSQGEN